MRLPDFIIMGAPKCGTTSIANYLNDHPQICLSSLKEPNVLMDQDSIYYEARRPNYNSVGLDCYDALFQACSPEQLCFESSVNNMYQKTALAAIAAMPQTPQLFFVLRSPIERVYSMFQFAKNNVSRISKDFSFSEFIQMIETDDPLLRDKPSLRYAIDESRYINYILPFKERFPEHVQVYLFEDLQKNNREFMQRFASRLGVSADFYATYQFEHHNETYQVGNQIIHRLWRFARDRVYKRLVPRDQGTSLGAFYRKFNTQKLQQKTQDDRQLLQAYKGLFTEDNAHLAQFFQLDLSAWA